MKKAKRKVSKKASAKKTKVKKATNAQQLKKMASKITKTTKKMVDDVLLRLIGNRTLEKAQEISAYLKLDKARSKKDREE